MECSVIIFNVISVIIYIKYMKVVPGTAYLKNLDVMHRFVNRNIFIVSEAHNNDDVQNVWHNLENEDDLDR